MQTITAWRQLTIHTSEYSLWQHQPLYQEILGMARQQDLMGVTVMQAIAGYGKHGVFRTLNVLDAASESSDLPLVITVIDREDIISNFYTSLQPLLKDAFVTCHPIEVW
ncbi:DUF190 domain-containing protein [Acaryochloris sp. CCMEE 5410]|uniref:DUF190 domain-containing protein n=1 Tax=Acaryochloris sp. CCMEE 5410 TaxID=310037 RepID=UPI000584C81A|nr:DUF190 domain-containing protein [Acaryochloris sp. CCMEE 5410]KAI9130100.1 DUF190 domain-containing protein [Acaryochloris sp. CCMEE 5410]